MDKALETIPDALRVIADQRQTLVDALDQLGKFSALVADSTNQTRDGLVAELETSARCSSPWPMRVRR